MVAGVLRKIGIESGEGRIFAWGALCLVVLGWADVSMKNVSEVFFLKRVGYEHLPLVFLVSTALLVPTTYAIGMLAARSDRLRLLPLVFVVLGATLLPLWGMVLAGWTSAFSLLVIASKQLQSIALLVFWIAMGDVLDGRQAKRLFAPMMAGVTLGTILGSFASKPIGDVIGIDGLLPFSAGAFVTCGLLAWPLRRLRPARLERTVGKARFALEPAPVTGFSSLPGLWRESGLFRVLFVSVLCSGLLGPMLYLQFQYVADMATSGAGAEEQLLTFYAWFRGLINILVLGGQVVAASRLYRWIGIPLASTISPLIYLLGFFGLSVQLSLTAGVGAMTLTKLQDHAVYDPGLRILYNLFPERIRSWASALLEGPAKRIGGSLGNLFNLLALQVGGIPWVGYLALPISVAWLVAAIGLWRIYPSLLVETSAQRRRARDEIDLAEMMDATTLRALAPRLLDPDPDHCLAAVDLVCAAPPPRAVAALSEAARDAPATTRPLLVAALDRILESAPGSSPANAQAAENLATLLSRADDLRDRDRADVVQAYGRLTDGLPRNEGESEGVLEHALADRAPAVRLVALAALHRRGSAPADAPELDVALRGALLGSDGAARRAAREELRAVLLCTEPGPVWASRLALLAEALGGAGPGGPDGERAAVAEAIADVAQRHGEEASIASDALLPLRADPDPDVRAAVLRFIGRAGLVQHASLLVTHLAYEGARNGAERDGVRAAAREGLRALGPRATDALLVELSFGRRSARNAIVPLVRELKVKPGTLRRLLDREVEAARRKLVDFYAIASLEISPLLFQRLEERVDESLHTALLLLAAIHGDDRIAQLGDPLKRSRGGRGHAILLEALESFLAPQEKDALLPLLEDQPVGVRARAAARALGVSLPSAEEALRGLLDDPEEGTRQIVASSLPAGYEALADDRPLPDPATVKPIERALLLKTIPLFERLTTRQLLDLAAEVDEESHPPGSVIVREGEYSDCLYVIVDGTVGIERNGSSLSEMGSSNFFGEIALFEGLRRTATVVARDSVQVLRLDRTKLLRLMEELPAIAIGICETLSRRVRELTEKISPAV